MTKKQLPIKGKTAPGYDAVLSGVAQLLEAARRTSVRATNAVMTATYWEIGRRIVEHEQGGKKRADYGEELLQRLSTDLSSRFGRGFSIRKLRAFRLFYLNWPIRQTLSAELTIFQTPSEQSPVSQDNFNRIQTPSGQFTLRDIANRFPLPWSHYVLLLSVKNSEARAFYEKEALRGGWSVRQLDRQINSQFYERTALSRNKAAMLKKGSVPLPEDIPLPKRR
jgi:hypothetical protein